MPGFILHIGKNKLKFPKDSREKLIVEHIDSAGYQIERRVVNKFMNDRLFYDSDNYLIVVEGVVLNNHELEKIYNAESWLDCVIKMYNQVGDTFYNAFRGSFSGLLYDKVQDKWLIYTNHTGEKQIFVSKVDDGYLFGSEVDFLVGIRKENNLPVSLDETGAYFTITHGFCIEDLTLIKEVRKLSAGQYYRIINGRLEQLTYHRFTNKPKDISKEEAIEGIDKYFKQAIIRAFEKDKEYGYKHIACLSGGLDSRMTVMVAHELGYQRQLNITFSQSNYLDFSIAQQIATDLNNDFLFKALDGGNCVDMIDEVTKITYGMANFFNLSHGKSMEDLINYDKYGIIHTGQIGDSIIGTFFKTLIYNKEVKIGQGAYSHEVIARLSNYKLGQEYENEEIFCLYTRAFTGANQGLLTFQENSESYSPFTDVDFLEFAYSIPLILRYNHKIYFDWILSKHSKAADYVWEKTGKKLSPIENHIPKTMHVLGYEVPHFTEPTFMPYLKGFILRRLGLRKKGEKPKTIVMANKHTMNPVDYWYMTNPYMHNFIDTYWNRNEKLISNNQFGADLRHLYNDCVLYDKLQALSVLSLIAHIS